MSPFGHKEKAEMVSARALVLSPPSAPGAEYGRATTLMIVLPDGRKVFGSPEWRETHNTGAVQLGDWIPVILDPANPDLAALDLDRVPTDHEIAAVCVEALGGPAAAPAPPDEWRVALALRAVEKVFAAGALTEAEAESVRQRIRQGI
jgi:hypothetical protein